MKELMANGPTAKIGVKWTLIPVLFFIAAHAQSPSGES